MLQNVVLNDLSVEQNAKAFAQKLNNLELLLMLDVYKDQGYYEVFLQTDECKLSFKTNEFKTLVLFLKTAKRFADVEFFNSINELIEEAYELQKE